MVHGGCGDWSIIDSLWHFIHYPLHRSRIFSREDISDNAQRPVMHVMYPLNPKLSWRLLFFSRTNYIWNAPYKYETAARKKIKMNSASGVLIFFLGIQRAMTFCFFEFFLQSMENIVHVHHLISNSIFTSARIQYISYNRSGKRSAVYMNFISKYILVFSIETN